MEPAPAGNLIRMSQTPDTMATGGSDPSDDVLTGPDTAANGRDERHEGTAFEPVPRDAGATTRPYPPEADPEADVEVPAAVVPGEQADPERRSDTFPEDTERAEGTASTPSEHVTPGSTEPPD
jgi:hypothetical protein